MDTQESNGSLLMTEEWQNKSCLNRETKWKSSEYVCKDFCSERYVVYYLLLNPVLEVQNTTRTLFRTKMYEQEWHTPKYQLEFKFKIIFP